MILEWLWRTISTIITRIFSFFVAPMNRSIKSEPKQAPQNEEQGPEGKEEKKRKEKKKYSVEEWKKYSEMPVIEKRKLYRCGRNYVTVSDISTWAKYWQDNAYHFSKVLAGKKLSQPLYTVNESFNNKVSLWRGDITVLEIDAIVNAANSSLLGGGGVDGCIHRAAGDTLRRECITLNGCDTGEAKITSGHKLPAKYIIHTVGPMGEKEKKLRSCYENCLKLVKDNHIETVAFCCISTGIYGYPNNTAAMVALDTVRRWLETGDNADKVQRIIFCTFLQTDVDIYENLLPRYFPLDDKIGRKDQAERAPADAKQDEQNTEDEEDISAGDPKPPKKGKLLSDDLAAEQGSNQEAMESAENEEDTVAGDPQPPKKEKLLSGDLAAEQGSNQEAMESAENEADTSAGDPQPPTEEKNLSGDLAAEQDSNQEAMESAENEEDISAGVPQPPTKEELLSGDLAAGQGSGQEDMKSAESEKEQEKLPTAKPSL